MLKFALTLVLAAGSTAHIAQPADARDGATYDGTWSVELVTESGLCGARSSYSLAVQNGQVRAAAKAASNRATVSGHVGADGSVGLNVASSGTSGSASGRLQGQSGAGTWKVSSLCSGRWTARRSTLRTARAD